MNPGFAFQNAKSVYYNGTNKGIAVSSWRRKHEAQSNTAQVQYQTSSTLVWPTGKISIKNANGATYQFQSLRSDGHDGQFRHHDEVARLRRANLSLFRDDAL